MVGFVTEHRDQYGVEPICAVVPIAPSTYFRHRAHAADPTRRSARAQRDDQLRIEIQWNRIGAGGEVSRRRLLTRKS